MSMGSNYGLGWVGSGCVEIFSFWWVGPAIAKVLNICKDYVNAFKERSDKIWLQAVKFVSCCGLGRLGSKFFPRVAGWVGLGQSNDGLGWIGSHKMDPWTTLG